MSSAIPCSGGNKRKNSVVKPVNGLVTAEKNLKLGKIKKQLVKGPTYGRPCV